MLYVMRTLYRMLLVGKKTKPPSTSPALVVQARSGVMETMYDDEFLRFLESYFEIALNCDEAMRRSYLMKTMSTLENLKGANHTELVNRHVIVVTGGRSRKKCCRKKPTGGQGALPGDRSMSRSSSRPRREWN